MFSLKVRRNEELASAATALRLRILEFSRAAFSWHGRNYHNFNRYFLVESGTGTIFNHTARQTCRMRPGTAFFLPANLDLEFDFHAPLRFCCVHFRLEALPGMDIFAGSTICREFQVSPEVLQEAASLVSAPPGWNTALRFEAFLRGRLPELEPCIQLDWNQWHRLRLNYAPLLNFIQNHASAKTSAEELAAATGTSYDRVSRRFRKDFGMPLKQFLAQELCRRAEGMLSENRLSIKEISESLGFENQFYFSRFFRKHMHTTPSDYRRRCMLWTTRSVPE